MEIQTKPEQKPTYPLIYERLSRCMADMNAVSKDSQNQAQGWKYRSIDQLKNASHAAFVRHQVFYTPEILEHTKTEQTTLKGSKQFLHEIKVRYRLFTTDGSFVEAVVCGEASDSGDKGLGKAQTYAEKVMLIQVLNIPTEEQAKDDPDRNSEEFKDDDTKLGDGDGEDSKKTESGSATQSSTPPSKESNPVLPNKEPSSKSSPPKASSSNVGGWRSVTVKEVVKKTNRNGDYLWIKFEIENKAFAVPVWQEEVPHFQKALNLSSLDSKTLMWLQDSTIEMNLYERFDKNGNKSIAVSAFRLPKTSL